VSKRRRHENEVWRPSVPRARLRAAVEDGSVGHERRAYPNGEVHSGAANVETLPKERGLDCGDVISVEGVLTIAEYQRGLADTTY